MTEVPLYIENFVIQNKQRHYLYKYIHIYIFTCATILKLYKIQKPNFIT